MRYKRFGKTGLNVSAIGLGTWAYGNDYWGRVDDNESIDTIKEAIDCGVNLIDTSPVYGAGHSEEVVGKAIKGLRDKVIISTKCGSIRIDGKFFRDLRPESIRKEVDASLLRLGIDVIDIYFLHFPDVNTPLEDTIGEIVKLKEAGKFKHFGVSNFDIPAIEQISKITPVECVQPQYSILFRDREEIISYCHEKDIGVMSYGSLTGGFLSGKFKEKPQLPEGDTRSTFYPFFKDPLWDKSVELLDELKKIAEKHGKPLSQVAMNFVIQSEKIATALVGAKRPSQIKENTSSTDWELSAEDISFINNTYNRLFRNK